MTAARTHRRAEQADARWERRAKSLRAKSLRAKSLRTSGAAPRRAVWGGMTLVGLGWIVQLATSLFASAAPLPDARAWQAASVGVAQSLMLTGFGLAILAALHSGFGALNRFFEAVLQRSAVAPAPPPTPVAPAPPPVAPTVGRTDASTITARGRINERPYAAFADGSIEVETLLGARRFKSIDEARAFVGS